MRQGFKAIGKARHSFGSLIERKRGERRSFGASASVRAFGRSKVGPVPIVIGTDSGAAKGFVSRRGLGKMRHIDIKHMWLQREVLTGNILVEKLLGSRNPADLLTKFLGVQDILLRLEGMGISGNFSNL